MRRNLLAALLAALAGCATVQKGGTAPAGSDLPDFALATVDGEQVRLSDYVGKSVIVLAFWDTWCEPCKSELPHLDRIYRTHKDEGLQVLAIAMDDPSTVAQVGPYVKRSGYSFPVLLDSSTRAASLYDVHKTAPFTVVIDRKGKIVRQEAGYEPGSEKNLEDQLVALLKPAPTP